jgi:hypothetical protein
LKKFLQIARVQIYVPNFELAVGVYRQMGLEVESVGLAPRHSHHWASLRFPGGGAALCLHDDPQRQYVDMEVEVADVRGVYQELSQHPEMRWLQTPTPSPSGWRAVVRTPDQNVWVLVEAAPSVL